jgi:hypothetical protein
MRLVLAVALAAGCASANGDQQPTRAAREIVSGAGRIHGGGIRMDVAVGHVFAQAPVKGTGAKVKSASVVAP